MKKEHADLHGNAPDSCPVALLIIDMINDLEFPEGPQLLLPTLQAATRIVDLKKRANDLHIPIIYANDNFGHWRSDLAFLVEHGLKDGVRGEPVVRLLQPDASDYVVLKPRHSAFFATPLATLLTYLGAEHLILTGISMDVCVQFTAQDAYLRDFHLSIPADCVAASSPDLTAASLTYVARVFGADTRPSAEIDLARLAGSQ